MNLLYDDTDDYVPEVNKPLVSQLCVGNDHSNWNEIAATQTGKLKCVRISRNILSLAQAVIVGHGR